MAWDVEARLYRGRIGRTPVSVVAVWNWRKYLDASESIRSFSSLDVALSSEDSSENAHDERLDRDAVGERGGTMSRKCKSSKENVAKGVNGGE